MRKLANRIETELKEQGVCAVYDSKLNRVWPETMSLEKRKKEIKHFADNYHFAVSLYDVGLCAVFEKPAARSRTPELSLPIPRRKTRRRKRPGR